MTTLRRYDSFNKAESLGPIWTLHKGSRTVVCTLSTHPLGWELAALLDGELFQSQVCKTEPTVFDTAETWRAAWDSKGWADEGVS